MRELIALAKAKPGQLNFAIGALGSSLHMAGEAFKMQSGVYIVNIPYRGTAPAVQDVLAMLQTAATIGVLQPGSRVQPVQAGEEHEAVEEVEQGWVLDYDITSWS